MSNKQVWVHTTRTYANHLTVRYKLRGRQKKAAHLFRVAVGRQEGWREAGREVVIILEETRVGRGVLMSGVLTIGAHRIISNSYYLILFIIHSSLVFSSASRISPFSNASCVFIRSRNRNIHQHPSATPESACGRSRP